MKILSELDLKIAELGQDLVLVWPEFLVFLLKISKILSFMVKIT